jgi:peptide/nickel transport system substrate-binding protein
VAGIKTVRELNPTTVQFICARPMAVGYMETLSVPIVPKHIWEHVSPQAAITSYGDKPPIIGSGPFETVAFVKGSYVEMVRNPYYWGKKPTIDKIYFEMYENPETMVQDLKAGRIDGAWGIPPADFTDLKSVKGIKTVAHPYYDWDYLEFNCYDKPTSLGNPVLLDWRFRNALNYAINKPLLAKLAYDGYAEPATTIINPGTWVNPDYHWQPPANEAYAFDLAKANQLLTAAGYPLRNGVRLNKQGKPIVLRLMASTDSPGAQVEAKLITGWLQQLGLTIKLSMIDGGTLLSDIYNAHGSGWAPDFDMVVSWWTGYYDPGVTLDCFTAAGIGSLNEPYWVNPTYDTLATEQGSTVDTSRRQAIIYQMQQLMYQQTPWIPLTYPDNLEAFNTAKWTGWLQLWGTGPAWNCEGNITSYLDLRPIVSTTSSSSSSTSAVTAVIVVVVVVAAVVVFVLMRRRRHVTEEA